MLACCNVYFIRLIQIRFSQQKRARTIHFYPISLKASVFHRFLVKFNLDRFKINTNHDYKTCLEIQCIFLLLVHVLKIELLK